MKPQEYSIKNIRQGFKDKGVFYTPPELALSIKKLIDEDFKDKGYNEVYDPTCGRGSLLSIFPDEVKKYGQEIDPLAVNDASEYLSNCDIRQGDTIADDKFKEIQFSVIIANPPFSIAYNPTSELEGDSRFKDAPCLAPKSKADYMFMLHCLYHLNDYGYAYILNSPGILYRGQREEKIRKWLIDQNVIDKIYHIPGNTFTDTSIPTALVVLHKNRDKHSIFMQDNTNGQHREVDIDEIIANGYNLSVTSYVTHEEGPKEWPDPWELEEKSRKEMFKHLRAGLELSFFVSKLQGSDFIPCLDSLLEILDEYTKKYEEYIKENPTREPEIPRDIFEIFIALNKKSKYENKP